VILECPSWKIERFHLYLHDDIVSFHKGARKGLEVGLFDESNQGNLCRLHPT
jgi:hypothetical protein